MKVGDTVKVTGPDFTGAIGTVVCIDKGILGSTIITVEPNENADCRRFYIQDLKVIKRKKKKI